jgi:hypothetical protein
MSVRDVTDDEVDFFREYGWARLPTFIDADTIAHMHGAAEKAFAAEATVPSYGPAVDRSFRVFPGIDRAGPIGRDTLLSAAMGRNMARLLDLARVRVLIDSYLLKMPEREGTHAETIYHQDFPGHPVDRSGFLTLWIALHDMPPEAGAPRFYNRSHTKGSHGWVFADSIDLRERCPALKDSDLSPAAGMKAGDATVHHALTVHGAPPNLWTNRRWGYTVIYMDADTRYTGAPSTFPPGLKVEPFTVLDQPVFPLVPIR